jgi:inner membrane protease ATP23
MTSDTEHPSRSPSASPSGEGIGYTPGDSFANTWRNIFSYLTGKMNLEGQVQFRNAKELKNEEADCKRCEDQRDYLLQYST